MVVVKIKLIKKEDSRYLVDSDITEHKAPSQRPHTSRLRQFRSESRSLRSRIFSLHVNTKNTLSVICYWCI